MASPDVGCSVGLTGAAGAGAGPKVGCGCNCGIAAGCCTGCGGAPTPGIDTVGVNGLFADKSSGRPFIVIICSPVLGSVVIVCVTGFTLASVP